MNIFFPKPVSPSTKTTFTNPSRLSDPIRENTIYSQCTAMTVKGERCKRNSMGDNLCCFHNPKLIELRKSASQLTRITFDQNLNKKDNK